jgi:chromosome segregation ATPase
MSAITSTLRWALSGTKRRRPEAETTPAEENEESKNDWNYGASVVEVARLGKEVEVLKAELARTKQAKDALEKDTDAELEQTRDEVQELEMALAASEEELARTKVEKGAKVETLETALAVSEEELARTKDEKKDLEDYNAVSEADLARTMDENEVLKQAVAALKADDSARETEELRRGEDTSVAKTPEKPETAPSTDTPQTKEQLAELSSACLEQVCAIFKEHMKRATERGESPGSYPNGMTVQTVIGALNGRFTDEQVWQALESLYDSNELFSVPSHSNFNSNFRSLAGLTKTRLYFWHYF